MDPNVFVPTISGRRPKIAVIPSEGRAEECCDALHAIKAEPTLITDHPLYVGRAELEGSLAVFQGGVGHGGRNLHAKLFNERPLASDTGLDYARDAGQIAVFRTAMAHDVPTFGVCLGMQLGAIAQNKGLGRCVTGHVPEGDGTVRMPIRRRRGSLLDEAAAGDPFFGACMHTQVVYPWECDTGLARATQTLMTDWAQKAPAQGATLVVTGWTDDGLIHAVERPDGLFTGTQFHPEKDPYGGYALLRRWVERCMSLANAA